jgi:hypothetical protein
MGKTMSNETQSSMHEKIKALLRKTVENGCTEAEAMAALAKARAMMDTYGITEAELREAQAEGATIQRSSGARAKDPHEIARGMVFSIGRFTSCKGFYSPRDGEINFCGLRSDIDLARYLTNSLKTFVEGELLAALLDYSGTGRNRKAFIASFVLGCTRRISERLDELAPKPMVETGKARMVVRDAAINDALNKAGIYLYRGRGGPKVTSSIGYHAGRKAGDGACFGRPVGGGPLRLGSR